MNGTDLMVIPDNLSREDESLAMNGVGRIAIVMGIKPGKAEAESPTYVTANATLIASAPCLLAALEELVSSPVVSGSSAHIRDYARQHGSSDPYAQARAAIAKAKGEKP